ncbi:hypothetical protein [Clostridium kluyveri]|uniref:hypothetical protein n=1 Tax=Clostridium kluyveri TaxID=1534 RepID=UPI0022477A60|nr:hypothetical protein [Clostridium kluyveri]UZQ48996.1 hypothetical protein OP486_13545 [Clostridium kluyveri]
MFKVGKILTGILKINIKCGKLDIMVNAYKNTYIGSSISSQYVLIDTLPNPS